MRIILEKAFILHTRPFNDTSLILEVFTLSHGKISLLAKGARTRFRGLLRPFIPLSLSWSGKTELMHLNAAEMINTPFYFTGNTLSNGFYLNELLLRLLPRLDPYPDLFEQYHIALTHLQDTHEAALRIFETTLLAELGYGFPLDKETLTDRKIDPESYYVFTPGNGLSLCDTEEDIGKIFLGKHLLALQNKKWEEKYVLHTAKKLNRLAIGALLGNKPIKSRLLFNINTGFSQSKDDFISSQE